jgi:hypothetical protein
LNIDRWLKSDVGLDYDRRCRADGLVNARIPPVHCGGPSMLDGLHVMHRLRSHRMVDLKMMARREEKTTFQAFNRGLVPDWATDSSTICLNDRIHDR